MNPIPVSEIDLAFPASVRKLMPAYEDIPAEFKGSNHPWVKWQCDWFYYGLQARPVPKPGIDLDTAIRHLHCIQGAFEPKHQHKMAAVAYLASLWFESTGEDEMVQK